MAQAPVAAPEAPVEEAPAEGGSNQFAELVSNISDGLTMLVDVVGSANIDPEAAQGLQGVSQQFQQIVEAMMSKGQAQAGGSGMSSPQAGGAQAQMASPAGIPRG